MAKEIDPTFVPIILPKYDLDFPDYEINRLGQIRNKRTGFLLKGTPNAAGYLVIALYKHRKRKMKYIHILVAQVFISNPFNLPIVDHIKDDKNDCSINNLQWLTRRANTQKARKRRKSTSSRYLGVTWQENRKKWRARYTNEEGKRVLIGRYDAEIEAALAYDKAVCTLSNTHVLNFPDPSDTTTLPKTVDEHPSSRFFGVSSTSNGRWCGHYAFKSKLKYVGTYDTEEEAAVARDEAIHSLPDHSTFRFNFNDEQRKNLLKKYPELIKRVIEEEEYDDSKEASSYH